MLGFFFGGGREGGWLENVSDVGVRQEMALGSGADLIQSLQPFIR